MATDRSWLRWSLLAMCCLASNNFLLSVIGKLTTTPVKANIKGITIIWIVSLAAGVIGAIVLGWRRLLEGICGARNFFVMVFVGLINATAMFALTLAIASDPDNAGPITAVLPLNALLVSVICWIKLGETLSGTEFAGVAIACTGPLLMSLADASSASLNGISFGLATAFGFGSSNTLRKILVKRGCNSSCILVVFYLTIGLCSLVAVPMEMDLFDSVLDSDALDLILCAVASGLFWVLGGVCFQWALVGKAGPAAAVMNLNSIGVLALQLLFFRPEINVLKVLGMACCLSGVTLLTLKPHLVIPGILILRHKATPLIRIPSPVSKPYSMTVQEQPLLSSTCN